VRVLLLLPGKPVAESAGALKHSMTCSLKSPFPKKVKFTGKIIMAIFENMADF